MSNHIHIVATFQNRVALQNFLRTSTALIARAMTGARKGRPFRPAAVAHPVNTKKPASEMSARRKRDALLKNSTHLKRQTRQSVSAPNYSSTDQKQNAQRVRFFDHVVFSRVVNGLRDFVGIKRYLRKNEAECELGAHARHVIEQFERAARDALHKQISVWSR
jgi:hypothetical protein